MRTIEVSGTTAIAPVWKRNANATTALFLVAALAVSLAAMRVSGTLGPRSMGWLLPVGFVLMAITPWLLLQKQGRALIGLRRPTSGAWFLYASCAGAGAALACFALGAWLFGSTPDHWYVSIAATYRKTMDTSAFSLLQLHLVFTLPALVFSPIGEEIFFRGVLQTSLEQKWNPRTATVIECTAFGLVHLCHHGLVAGAAGLALRPLSGAIWVGLMFGTAWMFAAIRRRSGSLYPAIAAHMAFNLAMNTVIFAALWPPA